MDHQARPLTKRPRSSIACDSCRKSKAKCDGGSPTCERCRRLELDCGYTLNTRDKRIERHENRKTNLELRAKIAALERQLVTAGQTNRQTDSPSSTHHFPVRNSHQEASENSACSNNGSPDSSVDVVAASVFDHPSSGRLCYFGWSSNHAMFWSLGASIANLGHNSSHLHQESLRLGSVDKGYSKLPHPASSVAHAFGTVDSTEARFPTRQVASRWISQFFDTVGAVAPYLTESALRDSLQKLDDQSNHGHAASNSLQALINIVFAHALSTMDEGSPEPFYRQTLSLLNPKTIYTPGLELLQTLLLLGLFQQNSQRSAESLTTHALAVKTAYQLGLHAPAAYEALLIHEKELYCRLWLAVVNQDRMLSTALGQPCLVSRQHVRLEMTNMLTATRQSRTVEVHHTHSSLTYFQNLVYLHDIMGTALDSLYDSNISTSNQLYLEDVVSRTLDLSIKLDQWRSNDVSVQIISLDADFSSWSLESWKRSRYDILVSIFYYRTILLIHGSLLMTVLETVTPDGYDTMSRTIQDTVKLLLKNDYLATTGMLHILVGVLQYQRSFLKSNAIWWTSNYAALTISLHVFAFWVASNSAKASFIALDMSCENLETHLRRCLDTLRDVGNASAMSIKAHRCLHRHLNYLVNIKSTSMASLHSCADAPTTITSPSRSGHAHVDKANQQSDPLDLSGSAIPDSVPDLNELDFMDTGLLDLDFMISDWDAAAFI